LSIETPFQPAPVAEWSTAQFEKAIGLKKVPHLPLARFGTPT